MNPIGGLRTFCLLASIWLSLPILFTLAVPAPRNIPAQQFPACYDMDWGHVKQISAFRVDGTYHSPRYGDGTWSIQSSEDGWTTVLFLERNTWYAISVDASGIGVGCPVWWDDDGFTRYGGQVNVKIVLRKALPKGDP